MHVHGAVNKNVISFWNVGAKQQQMVNTPSFYFLLFRGSLTSGVLIMAEFVQQIVQQIV